MTSPTVPVYMRVAAHNVLRRKRFYDEELRQRELAMGQIDKVESSFDVWLTTLFPNYFPYGFAEHHKRFWHWIWNLKPHVRPDPYVAIWARGGAKSTSAETACVAVGAMRLRQYVWYVSGIQEQADSHVANIQEMLEQDSVGKYYPSLALRRTGKYGQSRGWRRNRLTTASGLTIDAFGVDKGVRGIKQGFQRPDLIVIDDVDDSTDTPRTTQRKLDRLRQSILPAGANDVAVLAIQNLVHPNSIFAELAGDSSEWLMNRIVDGPHPALLNFSYEQKSDGKFYIVSGVPTWEGQSVDVCQGYIFDEGISSFLDERQHKVQVAPGGMFDKIEFLHCTPAEVPDLEETVVCVDPAVSSTDQSDSHGIQVDGSDETNIYRLWSWEKVATPTTSLVQAIKAARRYMASSVHVETDQGGDTWEELYNKVLDDLRGGVDPSAPEGPLQRIEPLFIINPDDAEAMRRWMLYPEGHPERPFFKPEEYPLPLFKSDKAGSGAGPKVHRAEQMRADYERGVFIHVLGTHEILEEALRRFPKTKPLDLVDAGYWSWKALNKPKPEVARSKPPESLSKAFGRANVERRYRM